MSKVVIQGNASGTGDFTIAAPNSNTNRTLTLPDEAGTVLTNATTTGFPAGSVLQVVQGITTTETTSSSASSIDTTLAATITPTSASSKVLIMIAIAEAMKSNGSAGNRIKLELYKNGSNMTISGSAQVMSGNLYTASALQNRGSLAFNYLDSPSTTSATEYRLYFQNVGAAASVAVQNNSTPSTIILMEIAG